ncbi:MAG TPA: ABC transporter ATP-binding protein, partial [Acidimicrobiia bacterium]|nr:ABC transporter ATP-binding protein [Acidimicrobiia bacterium]
MTRSRDDLPPSMSSLWRTVKIGYRAEPGMLVAAFTVVAFTALPDALIAVWLGLLANGVLHDNQDRIYLAAAGLGLSATLTWYLKVVFDRLQRRFRDRIGIALESHVAQLQASVATIEHHERPEYLDRLAVLRDQVFALDHLFMSLFSTVGWIIRLVITIFLLVAVSPVLVLLVVFALPTVMSASWRPGVERNVEERVAPNNRLARHLFVLGTTAPPGKEIRVAGVGAQISEQRRASWDEWYAPVAATRWSSALWHTVAWAIFGAAYVAAIVFVAEGLEKPAGAVLLVLAAGSRLSQYVGSTVGEIGFLRGIWLDSSRRLAWLEDYA